MTVSNITTPEEFHREVLNSEKPVLVYFWAPWCGPCRQVGPIVEELARERAEMRFAKLNVDENQSVAVQFNVMSLPTLLLIKDGREAQRITGAAPKTRVAQALDIAL